MDRCILVCAVLVVVAVSAAAETIIVDAGGTGDHTTIQPALDAAAPAGGDTVLVMTGTYAGAGNTNLDFHGRGTVLLAQLVGSTIIDGGGSARAFLFDDGETADTVVDGFTVTNCSGDPGGAVYCFGSSPTIRNCWFQNNASNEGHGGAVYLSGSPATIIGCTFTGNSTQIDRQGGGIACLFDSDATLTSCTFEGNNAGIGAALTFTSGSDGSATDCWFVDNTVGCAIYCESSTASFTECVAKGNTGSYTGGVYLYDSATEFTDCSFFENTATAGHDGGGALYCDDASPVLLNCTLSDNDTEDAGGTVYCRGGSPQLTNCIIAFDGSDPAVNHYPGSTNNPLLVCCDLYGNSGGNWVGLIAAQASLDNNMEVDPQFCGRLDYGDFRLFNTSPCAAANNIPCGLVGALDIGCESPVQPVSWGAIKSLYR